MQRTYKLMHQLMRNPIRFFTAAKEELFFKIESENKKVIMKTVPFLVEHFA